MISGKQSVEERYYNKFYSTGEYSVRNARQLPQEKQYLVRKLKKYGSGRILKCLEAGSGGGGYRI